MKLDQFKKDILKDYRRLWLERKMYVDLYFLGNKIFLEQYILEMKTKH